MEDREAKPDRSSQLIHNWWLQLQSSRPGAGVQGPPPVDADGLFNWARTVGVPDSAVSHALAQTLFLPWVPSLAGLPTSADFVQRVPIHFARQYAVIGLAGDGPELPVVFADLKGWHQLDVVGRFLGKLVEPRVAPRGEVIAAINIAYQQRAGQTEELIDALDDSPELDALRQMAHREDLLDVSGRAPVIKLVNLVLFDAVKTRASDVHIQPYENRVVIRFRIDGVLFDQFTVPKSSQDEMISRVKVLGRMNIAEKRLPQDGRATVQVGDRQIDLRIASLPTSCGERVVIRLLDKSARLYTLSELGMADSLLVMFRRLIELEHGLVLVTGPTGAGKSTTLYAALQQINAKDRNVLTLEDPIEYQLEGISQTQVSAKKGMTFASGLRSVLRQDPDIVMVGEIRDRETADMAIQSALTGHMVFSTLHTNDAASAITRLLDLGVEPYLVASSLVGVLAQRLVRRICSRCRVARSASESELRELGVTPSRDGACSICSGPGCESCRGTGYSGRLGIFELMVMSDRVRNLIQQRANAADIRQAAMGEGMRLLRDDGVRKVLNGETTVDEVIRVSATSGLEG